MRLRMRVSKGNPVLSHGRAPLSSTTPSVGHRQGIPQGNPWWAVPRDTTVEEAITCEPFLAHPSSRCRSGSSSRRMRAGSSRVRGRSDCNRRRSYSGLMRPRSRMRPGLHAPIAHEDGHGVPLHRHGDLNIGYWTPQFLAREPDERKHW